MSHRFKPFAKSLVCLLALLPLLAAAASWNYRISEEAPAFDWKAFGFQEFSEFLNFAQDKTVVRIEPREEGLMVFLGAEFHPPALPEPEPPAEQHGELFRFRAQPEAEVDKPG